MISIKDINITVDDKSYVADLEIPSKVITSTKQDESDDIAASPNCFIYVKNSGDIKVGVNVEVVLSSSNGTVSMICDVVSKNQKYTTLQYSYGLTVEDSSDSDSDIDQDYSQIISTILGTDYNVVNDISEEEATQMANDILNGAAAPL